MPAAAVAPARAKANPTRELTIVAEWVGRTPLLEPVEVPYEKPAPGPRGYRVHVIDYDASTRNFVQPAVIPIAPDVENSAFHAQSVYAVIMRTLWRFEYALGRNVGWSFDGGHQIHVAPHAFQGANAFYSRRDRGLFFGYFKDEGNRTINTCLSHDVIAHETTHAILDGLREGYYYASLPDQAAFHEGFADVVALLAMFSLPRVLRVLIDAHATKSGLTTSLNRIARKWLTDENLKGSALLGLGDGIGDRGAALRRSIAIVPSPDLLDRPQNREPHNRGEILVAAVMRAFLDIWLKRIASLGDANTVELDRDRVADEGALAADHLLTMAIRALDYSPSAGIEFRDYLSALLTADYEVQTDDSKFHYRDKLRDAFAQYGITPLKTRGAEKNLWSPPSEEFDYRHLHFEAMQRDKDAVFRFIWQNRRALNLCDSAYTQVRSLRPCIRLSWDGFVIRETVAEYVEMLSVQASELRGLKIRKPDGMTEETPVKLFGGGVLIFDEYGKVKYHIKQVVLDPDRQERFIEHLYRTGYYVNTRGAKTRRFASLHRSRLMGATTFTQEAQDEFF